ncbi:MAG: peptidylprolyl isomerase [Bacteroidota bacterium]
MKKTIFLAFIASFICWHASAQTLPKVEMETSFGEIIIEIDTVNAPITSINFLNHVEKGNFMEAIFYRVVRMDNQPGNDIKIEVIQGGLFDDKKIEKIETIRHETTKETGLKHLNGTISMARMDPGTASTEFFICVGEQPDLDYGGNRNSDEQGFAAFGQVVKGMDVVRKIQKAEDNNQYLTEPVSIQTIAIIK